MIIKIFLILVLLVILRPTLISIMSIKNSVQIKPKIENTSQKPQLLSSAKSERLVISFPVPKALIKNYDPLEKENPDNFIAFFPGGSPVIMDTSGSSSNSSTISVHIFPPI